MSKQSEAKAKQGYCETSHCCGNCGSFTEKRETVNGDFGSWEKVGTRRCGIGGFAVKKTGWCNQFNLKAGAK